MTNQSPPATPASSSDASTTLATNIETIIQGIATATKEITEPTAITAIEGFLTALPQLLTLIQEFQTFIGTFSGENPQNIIANLGQAFGQWNQAKTVEDRQNAAATLASIISKFPTHK